MDVCCCRLIKTPDRNSPIVGPHSPPPYSQKVDVIVSNVSSRSVAAKAVFKKFHCLFESLICVKWKPNAFSSTCVSRPYQEALIRVSQLRQFRCHRGNLPNILSNIYRSHDKYLSNIYRTDACRLRDLIILGSCEVNSQQVLFAYRTNFGSEQIYLESFCIW